MRKSFGICWLILILSLASFQVRGEEIGEGAGRVLELVDIPTAHLYSRGDYEVKLRIYDQGSLLFRFALSLTDWVMLGVPLDIEHFIGREEIEVALPPVIWAKIRLTKEGGNLWPMAIGYDPTDYGEDEKEDKRVRGLYFVCTKPTYLHNLPIQWHFGVNANIEDIEDRGICSFGGLDLSINPYLLFYVEVDGVSLEGKDDPFFNLGLRYLATEDLELEIGVRDVGDKKPDRLISFRYSHQLF